MEALHLLMILKKTSYLEEIKTVRRKKCARLTLISER